MAFLPAIPARRKATRVTVLAACALIPLIAALGAFGQPWSGILSPVRAVDWSGAGVQGGIVDRTTVYQTLSPGVTADQINAAITACPEGQVVFLAAGTYNLSSGIVLKSNVTVRGAGADKTFLVFSGVNACFGGYSVVCFTVENHVWGGDPDALPGGSNAAVWTAGFARGTTQITLTRVGSSGLAVGQYIMLDQANLAADNGEFFVCDNTNFPCSLQGGNGGRVMNGIQHGQTQIVKITAINGSTYTITPGLYAPNWSATLSPGAWWVHMIQFAGLEDVSLDHSNAAGEINGISMYGAINCWVRGIRSIRPNRNHVQFCVSAHNTVADCYFNGTQHGVSESYGVETYLGSDNLVVNNIFQQVTAPQLLQLGVGNVVAFNFSIKDSEVASADFLYGSATDHNEGNEYDLLEGNDGSMFGADLFHGTGGLNTLFRNRFTGWEAGKLNNLIPVRLDSYKRYCNVVGNVLGTAGITTQYQTPAPYGSGSVYSLGNGNSEGAVTVPADPMVATTLMRWGNYDVVNDSARWEASEVPSGIAKYANPVPANKTLPASFFLSAKPSWWPSGIAWPPIGPDVTGGTLAGLAGHAHQIPACNCYANVMNGPADGSGVPLSFNADSCYGSLSAVMVAPRPRYEGASFSIRRASSGREWIITVRNASAPFPVCVYDLRGRLQRALSPSSESRGGFAYVWDGTDAQGQKLTKGVYVIRGNAGEAGKMVTVF
jgi:hypothetical protein